MTVNASFADKTAPSPSISTTSNLKTTSQTATLKCTDGVGVTSYYWGTNASPAASDYTTITSTTSMSVNKTVSAAGTYYLICKDAAGNASSSTNKTYRSYTVNNMLLNVKGTKGTYTTANYTSASSATYIIPNSTVITLTSIYTTPTGGTYVGTSSGAASTTAATLLTSNPTITANTTYTAWFNRNEYTITVATGGNGSVKVTSENNTTGVTATSSSTNQTLTARYGEKISATATPNSGFKFSSWSSGLSGSTNPASLTVSASVTIKGSFADNSAPTCSFGSFSPTSTMKGSTATITLTCKDNVGVVTNTLTSSSFTISNTSAISISSITSSAVSGGYQYVLTIIGGDSNASSTISLKAGSVKDAAGNSNAAVTSASITNIADQSGPEISFDPNGNMTYSKSQSTKVTVTDMSNVASAKYLWTQTKGASAANGTSFTSGSTITKNSGDGLWYLCVYATDSYGNASNECSEAFALDNTPPVITASDICILKGQSLVISNFASASDSNGVKSLTAPAFDTSKVTTSTITITATDNAGNTATKTVTIRVFTKLIDSDLVTSGDGLYADSQTAGRYYYKGATPSNYLTFNGETWRILSVEADGSVKIIRDTPYTSAAFHTANSGLTNFTSLSVYNSLVDYYTNTITDESKKFLTTHDSYSGMVGYGGSSSNTIADTITAEKATTISTNIVLPSITDYLRASNNCDDTTKWSAINNSPFPCKTNNWMYNSSTTYWLLNAYSATRARYQNTSGAVSFYTVSDSRGYRPVVYLKATTTFQGSGTSDSPYTICTDCSSSGVSNTTCTVTTASGYDTSKTITITPSSTTGITYSWDGVNWSSSPSKNITAAGTYNGWIKDSTGKTNTCSITINSRTEYLSRSCTGGVTYGSWSTVSTTYSSSSCSAWTDSTSRVICPGTYQAKGSCPSPIDANMSTITSSSNECTSACINFMSTNSNLASGVTCSCNCLAGRTYQTRSCSCNAWGDWGTTWSATKITENCSTQVQTRTAIGEKE